MKSPIYLDYHSTTPCEPEVVAAMLPYFTEQFGNPSAKTHARGRKSADVLAIAKDAIGALINTSGASLIVTSGATEANNLAIFGAARALKSSGRNEIIISAFEHSSVTKPAEALANEGFTLRVAPVDECGFICMDALEKYISERAALVSVMAANHEIGTIQPIAEIAALAHAKGALFHTDATQAAGKIPLDVMRMDVDMLSFSAHKIYGPLGIGALYVRTTPPVALEPLMFGGTQQQARPGSIPLALAVGFAKACEIASVHLRQDYESLNNLGISLLRALETAGVRFALNGAKENRLPGSLNIRFSDIYADDLMLALTDELCLSSGAACTNGLRKPSPVLKAIGLSDDAVARSVRISLGRKTTESEVLHASQQIANAIDRTCQAA